MSYLASRTRYVVSSVLWCFTHVIIKYAILIGNPCSATVLEFLAWFILQLVVFKVTSRESYHSRLSVTKARAAPSCDFYPWEWCSSISCGKTPLYPAYTLPKALMTSVLIFCSISYHILTAWLMLQFQAYFLQSKDPFSISLSYGRSVWLSRYPAWLSYSTLLWKPKA